MKRKICYLYYKKLAFVLLLACSCAVSAQNPIVFSEMSDIGGNNGKFLEVYNASDNPVNIGEYRFYTSAGGINPCNAVFLANTIIQPHSTYLTVCYTTSISAIKILYPQLNDANNVHFINLNFSGGPWTLYNADNVQIDFSTTGTFSRTSASFDETGNLIAGSGIYNSNITPNPLVANIGIRRKSVLKYGYNASGNRIKREFNVIVLSPPRAAKVYKNDEESNNVSIETADKKHQITIYPNPVKENLTVDISGNEDTNYQYRLYDISGVLLQSGNTSKQIIEMVKYTNGIYILTLENSKNKEIFKIIKK